MSSGFQDYCRQHQVVGIVEDLLKYLKEHQPANPRAAAGHFFSTTAAGGPWLNVGFVGAYLGAAGLPSASFVTSGSAPAPNSMPNAVQNICLFYDSLVTDSNSSDPGLDLIDQLSQPLLSGAQSGGKNSLTTAMWMESTATNMAPADALSKYLPAGGGPNFANYCYGKYSNGCGINVWFGCGGGIVSRAWSAARISCLGNMGPMIKAAGYYGVMLDVEYIKQADVASFLTPFLTTLKNLKAAGLGVWVTSLGAGPQDDTGKAATGIFTNADVVNNIDVVFPQLYNLPSTLWSNSGTLMTNYTNGSVASFPPYKVAAALYQGTTVDDLKACGVNWDIYAGCSIWWYDTTPNASQTAPSSFPRPKYVAP